MRHRPLLLILSAHPSRPPSSFFSPTSALSRGTTLLDFPPRATPLPHSKPAGRPPPPFQPTPVVCTPLPEDTLLRQFPSSPRRRSSESWPCAFFLLIKVVPHITLPNPGFAGALFRRRRPPQLLCHRQASLCWPPSAHCLRAVIPVSSASDLHARRTPRSPLVLALPPPLHLEARATAGHRATASVPGAVTGRGHAHRASGVGRELARHCATDF
jgi:hypothetical protein